MEILVTKLLIPFALSNGQAMHFIIAYSKNGSINPPNENLIPLSP